MTENRTLPIGQGLGASRDQRVSRSQPKYSATRLRKQAREARRLRKEVARLETLRRKYFSRAVQAVERHADSIAAGRHPKGRWAVHWNAALTAARHELERLQEQLAALDGGGKCRSK